MAHLFSAWFAAKSNADDRVSRVEEDLLYITEEFKLCVVSEPGVLGVITRSTYSKGVIVVLEDDEIEDGTMFVVFPKLTMAQAVDKAKAAKSAGVGPLGPKDSEHFALSSALKALEPNRKDDRNRKK